MREAARNDKNTEKGSQWIGNSLQPGAQLDVKPTAPLEITVCERGLRKFVDEA